MIGLLLGVLAWAGPPAGWDVTGIGYRAKVSQEAKDGAQSGQLTGGSNAQGFGTLFQSIVARNYKGKRVRMTVWLKTEEVDGWSGAWLRVDRLTKAVAFDNMQDRALRGTHDWSKQTLVVDVPQDAGRIFFGGILSGEGTLWVDALELEVVDTSVPVTDQLVRPKPPAPKNLGFEG
ncbi:MAG: hypothetical protein AB8H79_24905 [Myxococcota bacterium]